MFVECDDADDPAPDVPCCSRGRTGLSSWEELAGYIFKKQSKTIMFACRTIEDPLAIPKIILRIHFGVKGLISLLYRLQVGSHMIGFRPSYKCTYNFGKSFITF